MSESEKIPICPIHKTEMRKRKSCAGYQWYCDKYADCGERRKIII